MIHPDAARRLRRTIARYLTGKDPELVQLIEARDEVLERYQPIFSLEHIPDLTAEEFKSFLLFKNNRHWKSINRQASQLVSDMDRLKEALTILLDEERPIEERLRKLRPKNGEPMVKGLARSVITPILLVAYPEKYGVLNQISESALRDLDIWPDLDRGADFAERYLAVNAVLHECAAELKVDLWTLDALWWRLEPDRSQAPSDEEPTVEYDPDEQSFGLEVHLHDFLRDNWDQTELGQEWALYEEDGEIVGYKFNTREVGEIDLLARHRKEPRWLVVELKRGRTSDRAVGQALRYRGWVKRKLAAPGETVEALVIGRDLDEKLLYAIDGVEGVSAMTYSVRFSVKEPEAPWERDESDE